MDIKDFTERQQHEGTRRLSAFIRVGTLLDDYPNGIALDSIPGVIGLSEVDVNMAILMMKDLDMVSYDINTDIVKLLPED